MRARQRPHRKAKPNHLRWILSVAGTFLEGEGHGGVFIQMWGSDEWRRSFSTEPEAALVQCAEDGGVLWVEFSDFDGLTFEGSATIETVDVRADGDMIVQVCGNGLVATP